MAEKSFQEKLRADLPPKKTQREFILQEWGKGRDGTPSKSRSIRFEHGIWRIHDDDAEENDWIASSENDLELIDGKKDHFDEEQLVALKKLEDRIKQYQR